MLGGARKALALAAVAAGCFALAAGPAAASIAGPARSISPVNTLESSVLVDVNAVRLDHGLHPLRLSSGLSGAADAHSLQMGADGYFAHTSADGSAFWKRLEHYYGSNGYGYWSVGENLLWLSPDIDANGALQLWMNSPEHRANLLNPRWREIGLSAVHVAAATGVFGGQDVTIVTADFGVRR